MTPHTWNRLCFSNLGSTGRDTIVRMCISRCGQPLSTGAFGIIYHILQLTDFQLQLGDFSYEALHRFHMLYLTAGVALKRDRWCAEGLEPGEWNTSAISIKPLLTDPVAEESLLLAVDYRLVTSTTRSRGVACTQASVSLACKPSAVESEQVLL